jgi:hypothetical protein
VTARRAAGWAAAVAMVAVAGFLAVLAADVLRWRGHLEHTDLRVGRAPANTGIWTVDTRVPGDPAAALLEVDDDVAFRRALQLFRLGNPRRPARTQHDLNVRLAADSRLADVSEADPDRAIRSRAAMLRGILSLESARGEPLRASVHLRRALGALRTAIKLDAANTDAKYDLELVLRLIRVAEEQSPGGRGGQRGGSSEQGAGSSESSSGF